MNVIITEQRPRYRRYQLQGDMISGFIVLERYGEVWNLELMEVIPCGQGYGTYFLQIVLQKEGLDPNLMTVCPISEDSRRFFRRHGFAI
jgi:hypothetical protein